MVAVGVPAVLESPTAGCVRRARAAPGDGGGHGWAPTASPGTNPGTCGQPAPGASSDAAPACAARCPSGVRGIDLTHTDDVRPPEAAVD